MAESDAQRRRVLLVGWDAADWKVIRPLMDAGKMPNMSRLVRTGCTASIATLQPSFSPMLWTSIATGKRPFDHGIHGFTEPRPDGRGIQRVTNLSRKCKALWNILGQNGMRSIVVGWWPSYPAEPIHGTMVSDQFHRTSRDFKTQPGIVHPAQFGDSLAALRLNPEDLPADLMEFFVPRAREIDQHRNRKLLSVARVTAECANIHSAATWLMDHEAWDLCAVYFDAIDHYGHGFMKFNPPHRDGIDEASFALFHNVLQAGYQLHDMMLGNLVARAEGAAVILLSDHGFHPDHLRPAWIPHYHAGPASEHRNNGILVMVGPGIRQGVELPGAGLLDITPTVLALFGLPAGADMEGRVLTGALEPASIPKRIPSWEKMEGDDGRHPPHMQLDPMAATESLEQLVALGYVEEPDADHEKAVKDTVTDLRTNLAEAYQDAGRHAEAAAILRELRAENPDDQRIVMRLFLSAQALRLTGEMQAIAEEWITHRRELYDRSLIRFNELRQSAAAPDGEQRAELKRLRHDCRYDPSLALFFRAQVFRAHRRWSDALATLDRIPEADLIRPGLSTDRADLLARLSRWDEARQVLGKALDSDPTNARVFYSLSRVELHQRDFEAAAQSALSGLALLDRDPAGHYLLGIALTGLRRFSQAKKAFEQALSVNPNFPQAHLWLARILRRGLDDREGASAHSLLYRNLTQISSGKPASSVAQRSAGPAPRPVSFAASSLSLPPLTDEVVIVCGLPRSGTSMLMQMLVAGGLTPLTDGIRAADEDNPRGYFEFEPVKKMQDDPSWFEQARGKVVKIVAPLIPGLPDTVPCRVILIERDFDEILASQRQMIARRGRKVEQTPERVKRLQQEYLRLIIWTKGFLAGRPGTRLMCVNRKAVLLDPLAAADALNRFLGGNLDAPRMSREVKVELNRQQNPVRIYLRNPCYP